MKPSSFANAVIRLRWLVIALFLGTTGFFAAQLPNSRIDTEIKNQLPPDLPTRVNLKKIEELFGGTDLVMIVLSSDDMLRSKTLERLKTLTGAMQKLEGLDQVVSLFTAKHLKGEEGEMIVEPAVPSLPSTDSEREKLREKLKSNPLVYGNLLSKDFKNGVLIGFLDPKASDEALIRELETLVEKVPGEEATFLGGMPVTRVALTRDMQRDMRSLLPVGLGIMLVFLFACFRQARAVAMPFVMTVMAIVVAMGLVPLLGWKIHTATILLPVILLAVANDYGIHMMARYQEDNTPGSDLSSAELSRRGITALTAPVLATGLTTMVGLLSLTTHIIVPAKQLGVLAAAGVGFAILGSLTFIPAVLAVLPRAKPILDLGSKTAKRPLIDRGLSACARFIPGHARAILIVSVVAALLIGVGVTRVVVDTNPMSFYGKSEPIWQSTHLLNQKLGGFAGVAVAVEGDVKDPAVLRQIDGIEQHLKKHPQVGHTASLAGVMRTMNRIMNDGDPAFDRIPESRELVAQYLLLYSMSGDQDDFAKIVDFDYRHAQVMAKITDSSTSTATDVVDYTRAYLERMQGKPKAIVGGLPDVMAELVHHIVWGQIVSIVVAIVLVAAMVAAMVRSLVGGLLAVFPLVLTVGIIFGLMGLAGIELNPITALLSSITIGAGVDYSIYFLWRYRDERRRGLAPDSAIEETLVTTGRGIVFNALSVVVGFIVLVISLFYPVRYFGILVAASVLAALIGALVVLPAIVLVLRPKFLEPPKAAS